MKTFPVLKNAGDLMPGDVIEKTGTNEKLFRDVVYGVRYIQDGFVHVDINDGTGVDILPLGEQVRVISTCSVHQPEGAAMCKKPHEIAKEKGQAACLAGSTYAANPYPAATLERMAWGQGWRVEDARRAGA